MKQNQPKPAGQAAADGKAVHGPQTELTWDEGKGRQPYANQEEGVGTAAAPEAEAGDRGPASGRNLEQLEQVKRKP